MAPHSSTLAWKIPWMEGPGRLQSMGSLRVGHDRATSLSLFTFMHWRRKWQPTPVFLPGESQGRGLPSMGSHRVGHDWSDLAVAVAAVEGKDKDWVGQKAHSGFSHLLCENPKEHFHQPNIKYFRTSWEPYWDNKVKTDFWRIEEMMPWIIKYLNLCNTEPCWTRQTWEKQTLKSLNNMLFI